MTTIPSNLIDLEKIISREGLDPSTGKCNALRGVLLFVLTASGLFNEGHLLEENFLSRLASVSPDLDKCLPTAILATPHAVKFLVFLAENTEVIEDELTFAVKLVPNALEFWKILLSKTEEVGEELLVEAISAQGVPVSFVMEVAKLSTGFDRCLYHAIFSRPRDEELLWFLLERTETLGDCREALAGIWKADNPVLSRLEAGVLSKMEAVRVANKVYLEETPE